MEKVQDELMTFLMVVFSMPNSRQRLRAFTIKAAANPATYSSPAMTKIHSQALFDSSLNVI